MSIRETLTAAVKASMLARDADTPPHVSINYRKEQKQKAQAIEAKYQKQLTDKEAAVRAKAAELDTALADGSTTLGKANTLRSELYAMEQDYWRLRSQVNQEIGAGYSGPMGWGPMYCSWHDSHPGMYGGNGAMMGSGGGWCRW